MKIERIIEIARNQANNSTHKNKVGAVIFDKKGIISIGYNQMRSVKHNTKKFIKWPSSIHAEVDCIIKSKTNLKGKSLLVIRLNKLGELRLSKPCAHCQMYIEHVGISKVYYSTNEGEIIEQ
jgi:deoxycytidylate deaminase